MAPAERTPPAAPPPADEAPHRRQVWLTLFRLVLVTVLLGGTAIWEWQAGLARGRELRASPLYSVVLVTYLVSLALALALRLRRWPALTGAVQVALDVGLAAAVVGLTGWAESVFVFLFVLAVVEGGLLFYRRGALLAAVLALATYLPLVVLAAPVAPPLPTIFAHGSALLAAAALAGYLAEQLRRAGESLAAREVDLAQLTALLEATVQSVSSGLLTLDGRGRVTFLNRAGEQLTGFRLADVAGRPAAWFPPVPSHGSRSELDFVNARGERLRLGLTASPLRDRGGEAIGEAVVFQDLTHLRAMEARVQRSERLADLGQVAAGLAHELRNPLASMSGSVELLRGVATRDEDRRLMDIVLREAGRLDQLVTRFLAYSRPSAPRRGPVDLARLARETLEVFAHDPVAGRVRLEERLEPVAARCDADQLRQVLWNLLLNAAQAGGEPAAGGGGRRIEVRTAPLPGGGALLEVEDDGPGIAPEDQARLFTPFFTTRERGTGLGLATVQRIVDAHGGTVAVASAPGQGARFTVRLPPAPPE